MTESLHMLASSEAATMRSRSSTKMILRTVVLGWVCIDN